MLNGSRQERWCVLGDYMGFETNLGDIYIIAAARAIKKDIMIFNTNKNFALAPITLICAKEYSGGELGDTNPILMAYNGTHYESLETITPRDDNRAKEIVQLIKSNKYVLDNSHIQSMAKVSHNRAIPTKELSNKDKVTKGEYGPNKFKYKCVNSGCKCSFEAKTDLVKHNAKTHALHQCIICKAQKYGEDNINDHTKECREKRDKKRKEDDKKYTERKEAQPTYKNMYMHLMDETPKIVEIITEQKIIEETTKKQKKELKHTKIVTDKIPVGVPKIGEVYQTTDKAKRMELENNRIEKQHLENTTKKKENEDKNRIKTQAELSKYKVPKLNKNLVKEIQIERSAKKGDRQQQHIRG